MKDRVLNIIRKANTRLEKKLNVIYVTDNSNGEEHAQLTKLNTLTQVLEKS